MYLMYVDESGDPGLWKSDTPNDAQPSQHYILSGFIIPSEEWRNYLSAMVEIRRYLKGQYGLPMRAELHATELISGRGNKVFQNIGPKSTRVQVYKSVLESVVDRMPRARIISINMNKRKPIHKSSINSGDIDGLAWGRLIQRFNTFFRSTQNGSLGMIFADESNERKIRGLLRKMRVFNSVPSHYGGFYPDPVHNIIEDPVMRNSKHSFFVQVADLVVYSLYSKLYPKGANRRHNVDRLFDIVAPLTLKKASKTDPYGLGIVHL